MSLSTVNSPIDSFSIRAFRMTRHPIASAPIAIAPTAVAPSAKPTSATPVRAETSFSFVPFARQRQRNHRIVMFPEPVIVVFADLYSNKFTR